MWALVVEGAVVLAAVAAVAAVLEALAVVAAAVANKPRRLQARIPAKQRNRIPVASDPGVQIEKSMFTKPVIHG